MDGDGQISFLAANAGAHFDYGDGSVATAWVAGNDGILVRDVNHDGQASANEIVFATSGSDLQGLAAYDSNHDGQLARPTPASPTSRCGRTPTATAWSTRARCAA